MRYKGVNLGGWLLMEGYILHGRNIPETGFKNEFSKKCGKGSLKEFERLFRDRWITESDIKNISRMGANVIRVPFNHKLIEKAPYKYSSEGFSYLEKVLKWGKKHNLKIILDLHAACGSQNPDWHGDSNGKALLWEVKEYRKRTYALWENIVEKVKNYDSLLGYDLLNEPIIENRRINILRDFYKNIIKRIRAIDRKRMIYLEGNVWAQHIEFLRDLLDDNTTVSVHTYGPLFYTFNLRTLQEYPGKVDGRVWDKKYMYKYLEPYYKFSQKNKVKIFSGEFGINWRSGYFGELKWLEDILKVYEEYGFDYTYWTYKAIANTKFPDGLYQYMPDSKYVKREGPVYGWENYPLYWKKEKKEIVKVWDTKNYVPNNSIIKTLKKYFLKKQQSN